MYKIFAYTRGDTKNGTLYFFCHVIYLHNPIALYAYQYVAITTIKQSLCYIDIMFGIKLFNTSEKYGH